MMKQLPKKKCLRCGVLKSARGKYCPACSDEMRLFRLNNYKNAKKI